jgi:quinoprotein glucose dehydrogenase
VQEVDDLVAYLFSENALLSHDNKERKPIQDASDANYSSTGYVRFLDSNGYPAIKPPWGTLTAIDLNIGNILWQVTLGEFELLTQKGFSPTGTENYGGPIVTAGGLLFIAATKDERFRGFDIRDGALLWETKLPAGGYATPATYMIDGRQFVVVAAGGGKMGTKSGDAYVAFALPDD